MQPTLGASTSQYDSAMTVLHSQLPLMNAEEDPLSDMEQIVSKSRYRVADVASSRVQV